MTKEKKHSSNALQQKIQLCFACVFLLILIVVSALNLKHGTVSILKRVVHPETISKETIAQAETEYNNAFYRRDLWIAFHGGIQRALMKYETNNFDVVKDLSGFLHMPEESIPEDTLNAYAANLKYFYDHCRQQNIPLLYVQAPSDYVPGFTRLPAGMEYDRIANQNINRFLSLVQATEIPYLDVRNFLSGLASEDLFYKTDHHWAMPLTFRTFQEILGALEQLYGFSGDPDGQLTDLSQYSILSCDNSFLGSRGIRTGALYAGKDDFPVYIPRNNMEYIHEYYKGGDLQWQKEGTFQDVFLDTPMLEDASYNNKYNALMFTSAHESVITNLYSCNEARCLVIADSFGRQLVPYLSQCFYQTAYIDPQQGRFDTSVSAYIDRFHPDFVVILFNGASTYIPIPQ